MITILQLEWHSPTLNVKHIYKSILILRTPWLVYISIFETKDAPDKMGILTSMLRVH